jgi:integrase
LRDPDNFNKQWRAVRDELGVPDITSHSFRKTVATLIDDEGLSARIGADQLGHANVSMTQDRYMARGRVHTEVAELLDRTVAINDE